MKKIILPIVFFIFLSSFVFAADNLLGEIILNPDYTEPSYAHETMKINYARNVAGNVEFTLKDVNTNIIYYQFSGHMGINPTGSFEWSYRDQHSALGGDLGEDGTYDSTLLHSIWAADNTIVPAGTQVLITITLIEDGTGETQTLTKTYTVTPEDVIQADHDNTNNQYLSEVTLNPSYMPNGYAHEVMQINYARNVAGQIDFTLKNADTGDVYYEFHGHKNSNPTGYFEWSYRDQRPAYDGVSGDEGYNQALLDPIWASDNTIVPTGTNILITITLTDDIVSDTKTITKTYTVTQQDIVNADHNDGNDLLGGITLNPDYTEPSYAHETMKINYARYVAGNVEFTLENTNDGTKYYEFHGHMGVNPTGSFEWSYRNQKSAYTGDGAEDGYDPIPLYAIWASDNTIVPPGTNILITIKMTADGTGKTQTVTKTYTVSSENILQADHDNTNNNLLGEITLNPSYMPNGYAHETMKINYARYVAGNVEFTLKDTNDPNKVYYEFHGHMGVNPTGSFEWSYRNQKSAYTGDGAEDGYDPIPLYAIWASDNTIVPPGTNILITIKMTADADGATKAVTKEYTVTAEDTLQADHDNTNNNIVLEENQAWADKEDVEIGETTSEILVTPMSPIKNIVIPSTIAEDKPISLDLSLVKTGDSVSLVNNLNLERQGITTSYTAEISSGTVIQGAAGWDGKINLPIVKSNTAYTAPSGAVDLVINLGSDVELTFSQYVKVIIGGQAGKRAAWVRGIGALTDITTVCDSAIAPTNIDAINTKECYIDSGSDLVIWTFHFTSFAAYTPPAPASTTSGATGGGGGTRVGVTPAAGTTIVTTPVTPAETTTPEVTATTTTPAPTTGGFGAVTGAVIGAVKNNSTILIIVVSVIIVVAVLTRVTIKNPFGKGKSKDYKPTAKYE